MGVGEPPGRLDWLRAMRARRLARRLAAVLRDAGVDEVVVERASFRRPVARRAVDRVRAVLEREDVLAIANSGSGDAPVRKRECGPDRGTVPSIAPAPCGPRTA